MRHLGTSTLAFVFALAGCVDSPAPLPAEPDAGLGGQTADAAPALPDGTPPAIDPFEVFSACMTQANWDASGMGAWAVKPSSFGTICADCHGDGFRHFYTNIDNTKMFEYNRYKTFITGFFTLGPDDDGVASVQPGFDKLRKLGEGHNAHPLYAVGQGSLDFQSLQQFYELTMQRRDLGQCDPPGYPPLPQPEDPDPDGQL